MRVILPLIAALGELGPLATLDRAELARPVRADVRPPAVKRKEKPSGTIPCRGGCGRPVSANRGVCKACALERAA